MNLKVSENIYRQYVYIFSDLCFTLAAKNKTRSNGTRQPEGSYNENHIQLNDEGNFKNASGEFHCTLEMILD